VPGPPVRSNTIRIPSGDTSGHVADPAEVRRCGEGSVDDTDQTSVFLLAFDDAKTIVPRGGRSIGTGSIVGALDPAGTWSAEAGNQW
jgi:hypothetical protein